MISKFQANSETTREIAEDEAIATNLSTTAANLITYM